VIEQNNFILSMENIIKIFPGVTALDDVTFRAEFGEIHALVGENGAGKSTLMKVLAGINSPDSGSINLDSEIVEIGSPGKAQSLGISMIHQELALIPYLTVGQNIYLGREPHRKIKTFIDWKKLYKQAKVQLSRLDMDIDPKTLVVNIPIAQQQMVEVAKALSINAKIIVMDEPTSALTDKETKILFRVMRHLKDQGITILYISHRLEEIFEIADRVTVLRDGFHISTSIISDISSDDIVKMMVGRELGDLYPKKNVPQNECVLEVKGLSSGKLLNNISFHLNKGEVLGISGLIGAGRTELARALFGIDTFDHGEIFINGDSVRIRSPREAISMGLGFLTEDRKEQGLFLGMSVRENITISVLKEFSSFGFPFFSKLKTLTEKFIKQMNIRTPNIHQKVKNLSGGNQQKVLIARWLNLNPRVLILDEPTRGIDVGAKAEIYTLIDRLAGDGVGIIMISSELPEIIGISDRVIVIREGSITGEFSREELSQDKIMQCAATGGIDES
jgi:ribose transport system ATP-binding protein